MPTIALATLCGQPDNKCIIHFYLIDMHRYKAFLALLQSNINSLFNGAYKPGVKVSMVKIFTLDALHNQATEMVRRLITAY